MSSKKAAPVRVEVVPLASLKPLAKNPRQHGARDQKFLQDVIARVGSARSGVVDDRGTILAGNGFHAAAKAAGQREAIIVESDGTRPVFVRRRNLTTAQRDDVIVSDNRSAELSTWDAQLLAAYAARVPALREGWTEEEWAAALAQPEAVVAGKTDPDDVPAPRATRIQRGDIYQLGAHRLMCGDCTQAEDVARLMGGEKAALVFTDPPYGVAYQTKLSVEEAAVRHRRRDGLEVANDAMTPEATQAFVTTALRTTTAGLKPGGVFYVCSPSGDMELRFRLALSDAGLVLRQTIAWVKDAFVMGRQDYHWRHETILYGWTDGAAHHFVDDRTQDTVWECARPRRSPDHPTMKPVALVERAITNSSRPSDVICDPFLGSGSTLIACEQTKRRCLGMEISPDYCQVILDRWAAFTGQTPQPIPEKKRARAS